MAYDEELAERVREAFAGREGVTERKMFGGVGFMLNGNMCVGVHGEELIARLGPEDGVRALDEANVRIFDLTGRAMSGWVLVAPRGTAGDGLDGWVDRAVGYVSALPSR